MLLDFAHGYNRGFGFIVPPSTVDAAMIAPRMIGAGVRTSYVSGEGFPSFVDVHQGATGHAEDRTHRLYRIRETAEPREERLPL